MSDKTSETQVWWSNKGAEVRLVEKSALDQANARIEELETTIFVTGDAARAWQTVAAKAYEESQAKLEVARKALESVSDNPTSDSTGSCQMANNWTRWAKGHAREALEKIK